MPNRSHDFRVGIEEYCRPSAILRIGCTFYSAPDTDTGKAFRGSTRRRSSGEQQHQDGRDRNLSETSHLDLQSPSRLPVPAGARRAPDGPRLTCVLEGW